MRNQLLAAVALLAVGVCGWTIYQQMRPAPVSISIGEEPEDITFICTETGAVSRGEWAPTPAVNPKTGRRTLLQALYCSTCRKWYPAPPVAMAQRSPRGPSCPRDGSTLSVEEPLE